MRRNDDWRQRGNWQVDVNDGRREPRARAGGNNNIAYNSNDPRRIVARHQYRVERVGAHILVPDRGNNVQQPPAAVRVRPQNAPVPPLPQLPLDRGRSRRSSTETAIEFDTHEVSCWDRVQKDVENRRQHFTFRHDTGLGNVNLSTEEVTDLRNWDQQNTCNEAKETLASFSSSPHEFQQLLNRLEHHLRSNEEEYWLVTSTVNEISTRVRQIDEHAQQLNGLLEKMGSLLCE